MTLCFLRKISMISQEILAILQKHIQTYDEKCGKDYLIVISTGKKNKPDFCEITFNHYNYWHLLGCKTTSKDAFLTYENCKNYQDVSKDINLLYGLSTFYKKEHTFDQVFDFVNKAKSVRLGYTTIGPEQFRLTMAIGNSIGIIGYDFPKNPVRKFLIPKSCQEKSLKMVSNESRKILFILSKKSGHKYYDRIDYEIKKDLSKEFVNEFPKAMIKL
jgi:hypothetical protein